MGYNDLECLINLDVKHSAPNYAQAIFMASLAFVAHLKQKTKKTIPPSKLISIRKAPRDHIPLKAFPYPGVSSCAGNIEGAFCNTLTSCIAFYKPWASFPPFTDLILHAGQPGKLPFFQKGGLISFPLHLAKISCKMSKTGLMPFPPTNPGYSDYPRFIMYLQEAEGEGKRLLISFCQKDDCKGIVSSLAATTFSKGLS